ncbi:MAG: hypothetical protein JXB26_19030 [Candidatus Aminicenantes bacterium]|nr:hypothetical protein [Candidatus Aminicenantes bacterium]
MRKYGSSFICIVFLVGVPLLNAQLIIGQYEDEAPVMTWNILGVTTSSSLGMGGVVLARTQDTSCSLTNPALLFQLPRFSFSLNYSYTAASLFKYSLVNTGVLSSSGPIFSHIHSLDFIGASFRIGNWATALSYSSSQHFNRPPVDLDSESAGTTTYSMLFNQEGSIKNINISLSRKIFKNFSLGIGFNIHSGDWNKEITEEFFTSQTTISDIKSMTFTGYSFIIGVALDLGNKLTLAGIIRTPYTRKAEGSSLFRYQSPLGNTDIKIPSSSDNTYKMPLIAGVGLDYQLSPSLRTALDVIFFNWNKYTVTYFEETRPRDFRNVIKAGAGIEYDPLSKRTDVSMHLPIRFGVIVDPQPMNTPKSSYLYITLGTGIRWKNFQLDIGGALGKEIGSGDSLTGKKYAVTAILFL